MSEPEKCFVRTRDHHWLVRYREKIGHGVGWNWKWLGDGRSAHRFEDISKAISAIKETGMSDVLVVRAKSPFDTLFVVHHEYLSSK